MKTKFIILLAVVLSLNTLGSTGSEKPSHKTFSVTNFKSIQAHRQHNSAVLNWIFNSSDVASFVVQRSYDGEYFETIGQRGLGNGHWNRYLDETVEPGTNYYRIIAVMKNGSQQESPVTSVRIVQRG